jgi:hypothetical protein
MNIARCRLIGLVLGPQLPPLDVTSAGVMIIYQRCPWGKATCGFLHTCVLRQCSSIIHHLPILADLSLCAQTMVQHFNAFTFHGCGWGQAMLSPIPAFSLSAFLLDT